MKSEAVYSKEQEHEHIQYRNQIQQLREMMLTPGWVVLLANWQKAKEEILESLEKATIEGKWQFYRGQLIGFKQAIQTARKLKEISDQDLSDEQEEEKYVRAQS